MKHKPGSLFLQFLCRFGSLVDYLLAVGVFDVPLIWCHLRPQRLLGLLVAVAPAGAALFRTREVRSVWLKQENLHRDWNFIYLFNSCSKLALLASFLHHNKPQIRVFDPELFTLMERNSEKSVVLFLQQDQPCRKTQQTHDFFMQRNKSIVYLFLCWGRWI